MVLELKIKGKIALRKNSLIYSIIEHREGNNPIV